MNFKSLSSVRINNYAYPLVPFISLKYLLYFLLGLLSLFIVVELMLNFLAEEGQLSSAKWSEENNIIEKLNYKKLYRTNPKNPIWQTSGHIYFKQKKTTRRILVVGDSFVWGSGHVNANNIWWRQLERELIKRGYHDVEVVAAGLNGASTQDQLGWFTDLNLLERINPDIVIVGYVTNDPVVKDANGSPYVDDPSEPNHDNYITSNILPLLTRQLSKLHSKKTMSMNDRSYSYGTWELKILEEPNIRHYRNVVKKLSEYVSSTDIPWFFITLPNTPDKEHFKQRYDPVEKIFNENNLTFINLLDDFVGLYGKENGFVYEGLFTSKVGIWAINPANGHPGTIATRFYAQKTVDVLEQQAPHILEKKYSNNIYTPKINDWTPSNINVEALSPGEWQFIYPLKNDMMLTMPINKDHVVLSFELPVAINKITIMGKYLHAAELWFNSVDSGSGIALRDNNPLGEKKGNMLSWTFPDNTERESVNSIKVSANIIAKESYSDIINFDSSKLTHWQAEGNAYTIHLPDLKSESDHWFNKYNSPWLLFEDGKLSPGGGHSKLGDIVLLGKGRWSHWKDKLIFSSSDNSDPRRNGRQYEFKKLSTDENKLLLSIEFDDIPVRP